MFFYGYLWVITSHRPLFPQPKLQKSRLMMKMGFFFRIGKLVSHFKDQTHRKRALGLNFLSIFLKLNLSRHILTTQAWKNTKGWIFYNPLKFMSPFFLWNGEGSINFGVLRLLEFIQKDVFDGGYNFTVWFLLE